MLSKLLFHRFATSDLILSLCSVLFWLLFDDIIVYAFPL